MLTPEIVVEILKSSSVICRAQPPFWIRFGARLNDVQNCGMPLMSVAGGVRDAGSFAARPWVLRPRVGERLWIGDVDRPLGRLIGVAECAVRRNCCRRGENATCYT